MNNKNELMTIHLHSGSASKSKNSHTNRKVKKEREEDPFRFPLQGSQGIRTPRGVRKG